MNKMTLDVGGCSAIDENLNVETYLWIGDADTETVEKTQLLDMLRDFADGFLVGYDKIIAPDDKAMLLDMAGKLNLLALDFQTHVHEMSTIVPKKKGKKK